MPITKKADKDPTEAKSYRSYSFQMNVYWISQIRIKSIYVNASMHCDTILTELPFLNYRNLVLLISNYLFGVLTLMVWW